MIELKFKGSLCDGHVHMDANEYHEQKLKEKYAIQKIQLKKLKSNPALSHDVRVLLEQQIQNIFMLQSWRNSYLELRERYERETGRKV